MKAREKEVRYEPTEVDCKNTQKTHTNIFLIRTLPSLSNSNAVGFIQ